MTADLLCTGQQPESIDEYPTYLMWGHKQWRENQKDKTMRTACRVIFAHVLEGHLVSKWFCEIHATAFLQQIFTFS